MGSNIDPEANLRAAAARLKNAWPALRFSSVWKSKAMEVSVQPDFLNAVCRFETDEPSESILQKLQAVEQTLKKSPPFRYGPRTIDLDLLLADDLVLPSETEWQEFSSLRSCGSFGRQAILLVPHSKLHERRFVLEPLIELAGENFMHPFFHRPLKDLLEQVKDQECERTEMTLP